MWTIALALAERYWKPLVVVGAILGLFVYHRISLAVAHHVGYTQAKQEMQVQIDAANARSDALQRDLGVLKTAVADANKRLDDATQESAKRVAASEKAKADAQAKAALWKGEATNLMAIIARPKATDENVCSRADTILRSLQ